MEMDCKKGANFFQTYRLVSRKLTKAIIMVYSFFGNLLKIFIFGVI